MQVIRLCTNYHNKEERKSTKYITKDSRAYIRSFELFYSAWIFRFTWIVVMCLLIEHTYIDRKSSVSSETDPQHHWTKWASGILNINPSENIWCLRATTCLFLLNASTKGVTEHNQEQGQKGRWGLFLYRENALYREIIILFDLQFKKEKNYTETISQAS